MIAPMVVEAVCPACKAVVVNRDVHPKAGAFQFTSPMLPKHVRQMLFCDDRCAEEWLFCDADPRMLMRALGGETVTAHALDFGIDVYDARLIGGGNFNA